MKADDNPLVTRQENVRDHTVAELVDWCVQRNLDPANVKALGNTPLTWTEPRTQEEVDRLAKFQADRAARTEAWERETLARLREKYGTP